MADITSTIRESAPRSNFPQTVLTMEEVSAPNTKQLEYIAQYNKAAAEGDWAKCKAILKSAKSDGAAGDLSTCKITSEGFNTLVDEIKAVELYYNSEMDEYFKELSDYVTTCAQNAVGLNDNISSTTTSYSSAKIDSLLATLTTVIEVSLPKNSWKANADGTYSQTATAAKITSSSYPMWYLKGTPDAETYESFCYISSMETLDGSVVFTCSSDVPTVDLTIMIKGY